MVKWLCPLLLLVLFSAPVFAEVEGMLVHFGGGQLDLQGEGGKFHLHPDKDIYELVSHRGLGASWRFDLEDEHHPKRAVELGQNHEIVRALGQLTSYLEKVNRRDFEEHADTFLR